MHIQDVNQLQRSVLCTLAYFDIARFPLTREELYRYLWQPPRISYEEFVQEFSLLKSSLPGITRKWGYYMLSGQQEIIEERRRAVVPSDQKLRKAQHVLNYIAWIPFLKAIFITSSVASQTAHEHSDIDFFIITKPGRIWLVRFLVNLILRLLGQRIYGTQKKDRACLCFFVDSDHLDLAPWRIAPDDIHFAYWLHQMIAIYDPENIEKEFLAANQWTSEYVPYIRTEYFSEVRLKVSRKNKLKNMGEKILTGFLGNLLERYTRKIQWLKLRPSLKEKSLHADNEVVITEGVLKFHDHDTRRAYREEWLKRLESL